MIDSRYIDFPHWAAQTTILIAQYGSVPIADGKTDWKEWARAVVSLPAIAGVGAPWPEKFSDWRQWAHQFNQVVRLISN